MEHHTRSRTRSRAARLGAAVAAALVTAVGLGAPAPVHAGTVAEGGLVANVTVNGPDALDVLDGLTLVVIEDDGGAGTPFDTSTCSTTPPNLLSTFSVSETSTCNIGFGDFEIGVQGVPEPFTYGGSCSGESLSFPPTDAGTVASFTYDGQTTVTCSLFVNASILLIDKVVDGGDAASSDFTIEVLDDQGTPVGSGSDVADATCEVDFDTNNCGVVALPAGVGFTIAEPDVENYELTSVECDEFVRADWPPDGGADPQPIGDDGFRTDDGDTYCVVTNSFVPPPTTVPPTTVPPTTVPPTTVPPTTEPPTTTTTTTIFDAGVVTLPETGPNEERTAWMAVTAAALVLAGGALLLVRRRSS